MARPRAFWLVLVTVVQECLLFGVLGLYWTKDLAPKMDYFCETANNETLFAQPANTWSAVSYIVISWLCTLYLANINTSAPLREYQYVAPFLIACVGISSFAFHGLMHIWAGIADFVSLIVYICYELSYTMHDNPVHSRGSWFLFVIFTLLLVYATPPFEYNQHYKLMLPSDVGFVSLVVVSLYISVFVSVNLTRMYRRPHKGYWWLLLGGITMVAGFAFWASFRDDCPSPAKNGVYGHAAWHILTSFTMGSVFMFRESVAAQQSVPSEFTSNPQSAIG